jgi:quercetin 2,3-dioxygenase
MMTIIPSEQRFHADHGWLDTRWHFSFGDYVDPNNMSFSRLRVFNDDIIRGGGAFGMHPHRDMEIITYMISGELKHLDSLGHGGVLRPGEVQVMSAGKGIMHSEANNSKTDPLRLVQIWIEPRTRGLKPRWEQRNFTREQRANTWLPVVSSGSVPESVAIDQDAAIYVSSLAGGRELKHQTSANRHTYFFVIDGRVTLNGKTLSAGDQARISNEPSLAIRAEADSELILIDLP